MFKLGRQTFLALVLAASLAACQSADQTRRPAGEALGEQGSMVRLPNPLPPYQFGSALSLTQTVSGQYADRQDRMVVEIEIERNALRMIGLTPMGIKIFSLSYDNGEVEQSVGKMVPDGVNPSYILSDFQLTYWPITDVRNALAQQKYSVSDTGDRRIVLGPSGEILVEIIYLQPLKRWSDVELIHHEAGYTMSVKTNRAEVLR